MPSPAFERGISDVSVGRFGGFREEWPRALHLLACEVRDFALWMHHRSVLYVPLPGQCRISKRATWVGAKHRAEYSRGGAQSVTLTASLLSPAVLLDFTERVACLRLEPGLVAEHVAYPTARGIRIHCPLQQHDGRGVAYDRSESAEMTEPWMLLWFGTNPWSEYECPILLVLQRHPTRIVTHAGGGVLVASYPRSAGRLCVMPIGGVRRWPAGSTASWRDKGVPADVIQQCRIFSRLLQKVPFGCDETFRIDERRGTVEIRNRFRYESLRGDWAVPCADHAPVSPLLLRAARSGYAVRFSKRIVVTRLPTVLGYYGYAHGDEIRYTLPLAHYADHAIAPVRIVNSPEWKRSQTALEAYLGDPKWTFGGDWDYDPRTVMDSWHNVRVLGWCTWSLPDAERVRRMRTLAGPARRFRASDYHHETEPVSGREYYWDKQIFWQGGLVNWDSEWYNGMNLGGAWALWHYGHGVTDRRELARHFRLMQKWLSYIELTFDWAHLNPCTTIPGAAINLDGAVHAYEGVIAMARVAGVRGNAALQRRMKYLASKMQVPWWDSWHGKDYYEYFRDLGLLAKKPDLEKKLSDWSWIKGYTASGPSISDRPQETYISHYGIFDPELLEMYREHLKTEVADYEYRAFPKYFPRWLQMNGMNRGRINQGPHMPNSDHANFKDPHLIARALLFRESLQDLRRYDIPHTGQVLESFMVGAHPMVLFPAAARFGGNVWDGTTKRMVTTLIRIRDEKAVVILDPGWRTLSRVEGGCRTWRHKGRIHVEVDFGGRDRAELVSYYR